MLDLPQVSQVTFSHGKTNRSDRDSNPLGERPMDGVLDTLSFRPRRRKNKSLMINVAPWIYDFSTSQYKPHSND